MSPSLFPQTLRALRRWLAAAMMLAVWLTATPARCDLAPGAARLAAAIRINPAWPWMQLLWPRLPWGAGGGAQLHGARAPQRSTVRWHGIGGAGSTAFGAGGSAVDAVGGSSCNTDPNGCHPGP